MAPLLAPLTAFSAELYVAPGGNDANPGTVAQPLATVMQAQALASSGDTVYLRGGTYLLDNSHITTHSAPWAIVNHITKDGISYLAYQDETPIFDFSAVQPVGERVTAFLVAADDCVFKGFEIIGVQVTIAAGEASNTQSECFRVHNGNRNRFERLSMHDGMGIGWYLTRGADNLVLNCDAYNNRGLDSLSIGNVDGFGAHPNNTSGTGNIIRGCRAWFNSDDGFDLINADAACVIENCWAFYNGYDTDFTNLGGDGHGFKAGGYGRNGSAYPTPVPVHTVRFCLSVRNRVSGFYANHHIGRLDWINNTAIQNGTNYNMLCTEADNLTDTDSYDQFMRNNLGYLGGSEQTNFGADVDNDFANNYFDLPVTVDASDFASLAESLLTAPRQANGDLPVVDFARLTGSSDIVDAGVDAGFPFLGTAPDLGTFEFVSDGPVIASIAPLAGGGYRLSSTGPVGTSYEVLGGPTLPVPATVLGSGTFATSASTFDDTSASGISKRFYQVRTAQSPTNGGALLQEAETGRLVGSFTVVADTSASGGQAVEAVSGPAETNYVEFDFLVPTTGNYRLRGRILAIDGTHDSMFVSVDGGPAEEYLWDTARAATYVDDHVSDRGGADPVILNLTSGLHTVRFGYRENLLLDQVELEVVP